MFDPHEAESGLPIDIKYSLKASEILLTAMIRFDWSLCALILTLHVLNNEKRRSVRFATGH